MTGFVNRSEELERLQRLFDSGDAELAVVYGRRRLGKTRLVKKALERRANALFSRSGFTDDVRDAATRRDDIRCYAITDIVAALSS